MFRNYLKVSLRNIQNNKTFTFLNIIGLVIAFASSIFILFFVFEEVNYDRFHEKTDSIYRVQQETGIFGLNPATSWLLAETLVDEFPEITDAVRIQDIQEPIYIQSGGQVIEQTDYFFADNSIFDIFTLPLKRGNSQRALTSPHSVVITQEMADKYFSGQNAVGQQLRTNIRSTWYELEVTGILDEIPSNSDFNTDFILSWSVFYEMNDQPDRTSTEPHPMETWNRVGTQTYILLNPASNPKDLETKFPEFIQKNIPEGHIGAIKLQPLKYIHLYQIDENGLMKASGILYVYLFSAIAVLILLVAGINFVILSTANASVRAKEIGLRKTAGAQRFDIVKQFLSESMLQACIALPLAMLVVELLLPSVNALLNKQFDADYFQYWPFILVLFGITVIVGLLSGGYSALYLSALRPISALKNSTLTGLSGGRLRKVLITIQFTIFVALTIGSIVIYQQLDYVQNSYLGFDKEQLISIDTRRTNLGRNLNAFKSEISKYPGIVSVSAATTLPLPQTSVIFKETSQPDQPEEKIRYHVSYVDYDFFKTLDAHVLNGRVFSNEYSQDLNESVVLSQTAVDKFRLEQPVGSFLQLQDGIKNVIGIVDDFIVSSYYESAPMIYYLDPNHPSIGSIIIRTGPENMNETIQYLDRTWSKYAPGSVFTFTFVDDELNRQYIQEKQLSSILTVLTSVAIVIAAFGLFGLALFMIRRKAKEIGIRKILGATNTGLLFQQYKEFIYLVIVGNCIAWPIAWYVVNKWLQNFAYRMELTIWPFILSGVVALIVALLSVSWQSFQVSTANPIDSLRDE